MKSDVDGLELRESAIAGAGIGVFATKDLDQNTFLPVKPYGVTVGVDRNEAEIPKEHLEHCIARGNGVYHGPADFDDMELVWYLNHSNEPNAEQRVDGYFSLRPIKAGEEILIDYNTLGEPEDKKEDYYRA